MKSIHGFHFVKKNLLCHANFSFQIYFSCSAWPCSEVRCPHLCFPDITMRDPRPGRLSLTSCIIFGSHLDSYLAKGLDLIRGKEQVRCMLQVGGPNSVHGDPRIYVPTLVSWHQSLWVMVQLCGIILTGLSQTHFCLQGRQTHWNEFTYIPALSFQRKFGKQSRLFKNSSTMTFILKSKFLWKPGRRAELEVGEPFQIWTLGISKRRETILGAFQQWVVTAGSSRKEEFLHSFNLILQFQFWLHDMFCNISYH